jgi:hypothetical protein
MLLVLIGIATSRGQVNRKMIHPPKGGIPGAVGIGLPLKGVPFIGT